MNYLKSILNSFIYIHIYIYNMETKTESNNNTLWVTPYTDKLRILATTALTDYLSKSSLNESVKNSLFFGLDDLEIEFTRSRTCMIRFYYCGHLFEGAFLLDPVKNLDVQSSLSFNKSDSLWTIYAKCLMSRSIDRKKIKDVEEVVIPAAEAIYKTICDYLKHNKNTQV